MRVEIHNLSLYYVTQFYHGSKINTYYFNVINKTTEQSADAEGKLILYFLLCFLF